MSEPKITAAHQRRAAMIYVRQSTTAQISRNRESTTRQYDLVARATELGWPRSAVRVIDDDLGVSGASAAGRAGFAELAAQVGLGQVGIVLALEVSRLARNNADWYRLLDLAGMTDTLIADADGVYHPGLFNDRMLLCMKGTSPICSSRRSRAAVARAQRRSDGRTPPSGMSSKRCRRSQISCAHVQGGPPSRPALSQKPFRQPVSHPHQVRAGILAGPHQIPHGLDVRARAPYRVISPSRSSRARCAASRASVLIRSPAGRCSFDGARPGIPSRPR